MLDFVLDLLYTFAIIDTSQQSIVYLKAPTGELMPRGGTKAIRHEAGP